MSDGDGREDQRELYVFPALCSAERGSGRSMRWYPGFLGLSIIPSLQSMHLQCKDRTRHGRNPSGRY